MSALGTTTVVNSPHTPEDQVLNPEYLSTPPVQNPWREEGRLAARTAAAASLDTTVIPFVLRSPQAARSPQRAADAQRALAPVRVGAIGGMVGIVPNQDEQNLQNTHAFETWGTSAATVVARTANSTSTFGNTFFQ